MNKSPEDRIVIDSYIDKVEIVRNKDESIGFIIIHEPGVMTTFTTRVKDGKVFLECGYINAPHIPDIDLSGINKQNFIAKTGFKKRNEL
jgi:hypothetical protein